MADGVAMSDNLIWEKQITLEHVNLFIMTGCRRCKAD